MRGLEFMEHPFVMHRRKFNGSVVTAFDSKSINKKHAIHSNLHSTNLATRQGT